MTIVVVTAFVVVMGVALAATSTTGFCGLCHNMKASVTAYTHSPHAGINCEQCHSQPGPFFFLTAKLEALQEPVKQITGYETPILGTVVNASCRRCHTNAKLFPTISKNGINVNHKHLIEAGYQCTTCHSTVAHLTAVPPGSQNYPTMDKCLVCHNNHYRAADGTVAVSRCDLCHVEPAAGAVPASHQNKALWLKIHGTNGILSTCSACHPQLPGQAVPAGVPGDPPDCVGCHNGVLMPHPEGWLKLHGALATRVGEKACSLCHDVPQYCDACHQVKVPHPADWMELHAKEAAASSTSCLNCHNQANCQACHLAHQAGTPQAHKFLTGGVPAWTPGPTASPYPTPGY